ncbi:MAG: glycoside hydrolase family 28 protein, partial [Actinomycetota bacterium]
AGLAAAQVEPEPTVFPGQPGQAAASDADPWEQVPDILERIAPPTFPARRFLLTAYGAVGDGETDCTDAFRQAIQECHSKGGGRVVVPAGRYLTGAIHLKSNVDLHVSAGAHLLFSQDPTRYLPVVRTRYEGNDCYNYSPFIYALDQKNVAISGEGVIDGRANVAAWLQMDRNTQDQERLREMAEAGVPVERRVFGAGRNLRPNLIQFNRCAGVLVEGVTLRDGPMWTLHPLLSSNVTIRGVTIESRVPNGDGIDPESSRDVHIVDCTFFTRDDGVALKAGRNADGRQLGIPCENVVIQRCRVEGVRGARNGMAIGSEMSGGVRNVFIEDCVITARLRGISLKTNTLRGGFIEDIYLRNVKFNRLQEAVLLIDMTFGQEDGPYSPWIRRVNLQGVQVRGAEQVWKVDAPDPSALSDVALMSCDFRDIKSNSEPRYVARMSLAGSKSNGVLLVTPAAPILGSSPAPLILLTIGIAGCLTGLLFVRGNRPHRLLLLLLLWVVCGLVLQLELSFTAWSDRPIPLVENRRVALGWSLGSLAATILGVMIHVRAWLRKGIGSMLSTALGALHRDGS